MVVCSSEFYVPFCFIYRNEYLTSIFHFVPHPLISRLRGGILVVIDVARYLLYSDLPEYREGDVITRYGAQFSSVEFVPNTEEFAELYCTH